MAAAQIRQSRRPDTTLSTSRSSVVLQSMRSQDVMTTTGRAATNDPCTQRFVGAAPLRPCERLPFRALRETTSTARSTPHIINPFTDWDSSQLTLSLPTRT
jgi:hypothetical protein